MKQNHNESISKNILLYSSSKIYRRVLGILNAFIKPKLLTPKLYGLWNLLSLILQYASLTDFGSQTGMRYMILSQSGKDDQKTISNISGTSYRGSLYFSLLLAASLVIIALVMDFDTKTRWGLITISIVVLVQWYYRFYENILKAYQQFTLISKANYLQANIVVFLGIILLYFFNIYGAYMTAILAVAGPSLYFRKHYPLKIEFIFIKNIFIKLVKTGFSIMAFNFVLLIISSSDRIIVASFLGTEQLGFYAITGLVFTFLMQIPGAARAVVEPGLMISVGENNLSQNMITEKYLFKPMVNTAFLMPFLCGTVFFTLPVIIPIILPNYTVSIIPAQIITIGSYFLALVYTFRGIIIVNNRQLQAAALMLLIALVKVLLSILFLKMGMGLPGVALGSALGFLILFLVLIFFLKHFILVKDKVINSIVIEVCMVFIIMIALLLFLHIGTPMILKNTWLVSFVNLAVYIMSVALLALRMKSRYPELVSVDLKSLWQKKKKTEPSAKHNSTESID